VSRHGDLGLVALLGLLAVLLVGLCAALPTRAADFPLFAARIDASNAAERLVGGPDAIGGIGDWALGNGTLCAVISASDHEAMLSVTGGVLVDLGHCGRADDQWGVLHPLVNLSRSDVVPIGPGQIRAEVTGNAARVVTEGTIDGIRVRTRYALDLEERRRLRIETQVERVSEGPRLMLFGDVVLHGNRQLTPFSLDTRFPERSRGFVHPANDPDDLWQMLRALGGADAVVLVGGDVVRPGVSYGLRRARAEREFADGTRVALPGLSIHGDDFSLLAALSRPPWIGSADDLGLVELAQLPWMDLGLGERLLYEREIWVGRRADVASVTDLWWPDAPMLSGRVDDADAKIHVFGDAGAPVSERRSDPDGSFALRLPKGRYRMEVRAPGGRRSERDWLHEAHGAELSTIEVGAPARVELPRGQTMRLVFVRSDGQPSPLREDLLGFRVGESARDPGVRSPDVSLAALPDDPRTIVLRPGAYRVFATRGPEYSVSEARVELAAGERVRLEIEPPTRLFDTPHWRSADLHVHSLASHDSALPVAERLRSIVAQGVDVVVATEHDRVFDYTPSARALGLAGRVETIVGVESTSTAESAAAPYTLGHSNAFPLEVEPLAYRGGAPRAEGVRMRSLAADLRARTPRALLQLNHPRSKDGERKDLSYLSHLGSVGRPFEPARALSAEPNRVLLERDPTTRLRDLDFDLIELLNGSAMGQYRQTRADWWSLALQGEFRAATANSDSHRLGEIVALPRTYVRADDGAFDQRSFFEALGRGRSYGTTGPLLDVRLGSAGPGDTWQGRRGELEVRVAAAPWVDVERVRVYQNAQLVFDGELPPGGALRVPVRFSRDSLVSVEVEGSPGAVYRAIAPGFVPFAFSNPIFVDADASGRWEAPGLPDPRPPLLRDPLGRPALR